jgi:hypothetical protein
MKVWLDWERRRKRERQWGKGRKDALRVSEMGVDRDVNGGASERVTGLLVGRYRHR